MRDQSKYCFAKVCSKHPELLGLRYKNNKECVGCNKEKGTKRARENPRARAYRSINNKLHTARKKGLDSSGLEGKNRERLVDIIVGGHCLISGVPFDQAYTGSRVPKWNSPSFDQKNAGAGYSWENLRVVVNAVNNLFGSWGKERGMYVAARCLLHQAIKRGQADLALAVLQTEVDYWEKQCQSSSTSVSTQIAPHSHVQSSVSATRQTKRNTVTPAKRRSKNSSGAGQDGSQPASSGKGIGDGRETQN